MGEVITAIYEKGILKPLQQLYLKPHQKVRIILEPDIKWYKEFKNLLKKIHSRTVKFNSNEIEKDISSASKQIRKTTYACKSRP